MKKYLIFMLGLTILFLVACSDSSEEAKSSTGEEETSDKSIVVVLKTLSVPYFKYMEAGARQAGEDLGVEIEVQAPADFTQVMEQINMIDSLVNKDADAILVSPLQSESVVPSLQSADAKGVPSIILDTDAEYEEKASFIGTDNYEAGVQAGELLASQLEEGDKVAIIGAQVGLPGTDARSKGARDALEEAGLVIIAEQPADSDRVKATNVMENILQSDSDVKGVYSVGDDMALGALEALKSQNIEIPVVGTDGTEEAIQSILSGELYGTIAQSPYQMGYQGVESALNLLNGEDIEKEVNIEVEVVTKENAEEQLAVLNELLE